MPSILNATTTSGLVTSADNSGSLQLQTNNGTTAVTIDTSQRVGIGLTPVSQKLEVNGNQRLIGDSAYILWRNTADSSSSGVIQFSSSSAATIGTYVNQPILFQTNDTERMRLDTSGNLLFNSGYGSVATAYGCRAWVSYKGTATRGINGSGNVSSVTFNGTGDYTINFTTAMPDTNYSYTLGSRRETTGFGSLVAVPASNSTKTTSAFQILTGSGTSAIDTPEVCVAIFR